MSKVDRSWSVAATCRVDPANPGDALKAAYDHCAVRVALHGKTPVQIEVTVRVAPPALNKPTA